MPSMNVKVAVRLRPFNGREKERNAKLIIDMDKEEKQVSITNPADDTPKSFVFDHVYGWATPQQEVYEDLGRPILEKALGGYNGTIFAYGQTGAGKSYSMVGYGDDHGIIPKLNNDLFVKITEAAEGLQFMVTVSYLEIYNEVVNDLLNPSDKELKIRQHPQYGVYVDGLAEIIVREVEDIDKLMAQGNKVRAVAATNMNATSSRSHSIFILKVSQKNANDKNDKGINAKINLVDLAGSERAASTGATGSRLKEGAAINKSLSALGNVINALATPKKGQHIPYRDSKLTRILQESLGGNTITVMLCALSPADINYDETLGTLQYANRAKNIKNNSKKNEDTNTRVIRELREEIERLRAAAQNGGAGSGGGAGDSTEDVKKMEQMISNLEHAKTQTWAEKERVSKMYEEERKRNLANRGIMEWVMTNLKKENQELKSRLTALKAAKDETLKEHKTKKETVDKLRVALKNEIDQFSQGGFDDAEQKKRIERIQLMKKALKNENENLKNIKMKLKDISDKQKAESGDARAQQSLLSADSELRKAIQEDERRKMEHEHKEILEKERKAMMEKLQKEKEKVQEQASKLSSAKQAISIEEYTNLEMQLIQEKADKQLLMTKIDVLNRANEKLSNVLEEEHVRSQIETEKLELQHFQVFRQYRAFFAQQRNEIEAKYRKLLNEAIGDALRLAARNEELETQLRAGASGNSGGTGKLTLW